MRTIHLSLSLLQSLYFLKITRTANFAASEEVNFTLVTSSHNSHRRDSVQSSRKLRNRSLWHKVVCERVYYTATHRGDEEWTTHHRR